MDSDKTLQTYDGIELLQRLSVSFFCAHIVPRREDAARVDAESHTVAIFYPVDDRSQLLEPVTDA